MSATIIVEHLQTKQQYFFMSSSFSMYKSAMESVLFGAWIPNVEEGSVSMVTVCDQEGHLLMFPMEQIRVISIGGSPVEVVGQQLYIPPTVEPATPSDIDSSLQSLYSSCPECGVDVGKSWMACRICHRDLRV